MKRLLLPILGVVFCALTYAQIPHHLHLRNVSGGPLSGYGYISFLESNRYGYATIETNLPAEESESYADYEWFLIPVGEGEPMMYYIRQSNGMYLGTDNTSTLSLFEEKGEDGFKFFLQKASAVNQDRQQSKAYRLYVVYRNRPYFILLNTSVGGLDMKTSVGTRPNTYHLNPSPRETKSIVHNGDMELVGNYRQSVSFASTPPLTDEIELTATNTGGSAFFPLDYISPDAVNNIPLSYLIHSNASSGGEPEDGSYFLRLPTGASIEKWIDVPLLNYGFDLKTTIKVRSTQAGIQAGEIRFLGKQGNLISSQEIIPSLTNSSEAEYHDPEVWETHEFLFPVEVAEDVMKISISSLLEEDGLLDIDNLCITVQERPHPFLYWNPASPGSISWSDPANWVDEEGIPGNVPTKRTRVVLPEGKSSYPYITTPDYAQCSNLYLEPGASLGNQFYLDYDSAFIRLEFETMKWQALTAPFKDMYSGDYMFDRSNPVSEMKLYRTENPQTGVFYADWTTSFSTANYPLTPAMPFSFRAGHLFYHLIDEELGADESSMEYIDRIGLSLPQTKEIFFFYNDFTKLPTGSSDSIPEEGRKFAHRFIYEIVEEGISKVPPGPSLISFPTGIDSGEELALIGNPLLGELDFGEFYRINNPHILPEFKLLVGTEFVSGSGLDPNNVGKIESFVSVDEEVGRGVIPPLTAFVVQTKSGYSGENLLIEKGMSLPPASQIRANSKQQGTAIEVEVEQGEHSSRSLILISEEYNQAYLPGEDSRKLDIREVSSTPLVYSVVEEQALEVNRIADIKQGVFLEVLMRDTGEGRLSLRFSDPPDPETYLKDLQTGKRVFFTSQERLEIELEPSGNESRLFYLGRRGTSIELPLMPEIRVIQEGDRIRIFSPELLTEVRVYTTSGLLLSEYCPAGVHTFEFDKTWKRSPQIIRVRTESGIRTFKLIE